MWHVNSLITISKNRCVKWFYNILLLLCLWAKLQVTLRTQNKMGCYFGFKEKAAIVVLTSSREAGGLFKPFCSKMPSFQDLTYSPFLLSAGLGFLENPIDTK